MQNTSNSNVISRTVAIFGLAWKVSKNILIFYFIYVVVSGLMPLASAYTMKLVLDYLTKPHPLPTEYTIIPIALAAILLAKYGADTIKNWLGDLYGECIDPLFMVRFRHFIQELICKRLAGLDMAYFEDNTTLDLIRKTETSYIDIAWFVKQLMQALKSCIVAISAIMTLAVFSIPMALCITIAAIPRIYYRAKTANKYMENVDRTAPKLRMNGYLYDMFLYNKTAIKEMVVHDSSSFFLQKLKRAQKYIFAADKQLVLWFLRVVAIPPLFELVFMVGIAAFLTRDVMVGVLTIGSFSLAMAMIDRTFQALEDAIAHASSAKTFYLKTGYFFDLMSLPEIVLRPKDGIILKEKQSPKIEFRNVSFSYPNGQQVLENVSFTIEPGEHVAFVGVNGAGKTTIMKLVCRFYDVTAGEILVNDHNIKQLDLDNWRQHLSLLSQEFGQYHFTAKENIVMGDVSKDGDYQKAAKLSGAASYIEKLPKKYDQLLGLSFEGGMELSGGQWQKLAIARAFYANRPILIMDEPTSAVDAEAEFEIFTNMEEHSKGKTVIFVSHRFSTVRNAHKIFVVENGRIAESGSHLSLLHQDGTYAHLFKIQSKGYQ